MMVYTTISSLQEALQKARKRDLVVGFVPTMGALHEGHISLLRKCREVSDISVVSIFVNPTQFNDKDDLKRYPRTLSKDCDLLKAGGCDIVFAPKVDEMYPEEDKRQFDFGFMGSVMEGKHRPGHFNGVAQIVSKLFDAVQADKAFFGKKDFQQLAIINRLVADYNYKVEIVACPIVREQDGLAMSSRNTRLTTKHRKVAPIIYQTLCKALEMADSTTAEEIGSMVEQRINGTELLHLEYFEIVESATLKKITGNITGIHATGCIAVHAGKVRLIDNIDIIL